MKTHHAYRGYEMSVPPVFTADGNIVVLGNYEDVIPNGTLVTVCGKMKM